ncbi:MAG: hypothetical protein ACI9IL_000441 [Rickettsiales bacterium]|jgi:hypothetical protein
MNKISYLIVVLIMVSTSFVTGVFYSDEVKSSFKWMLEDGNKYKDKHIISK